MVPAQIIAGKFRSKNDIYYLLTVDAGAYLPDKDTLTIYFLKELVSGAKKFVS
jgi:hypothetical protein